MKILMLFPPVHPYCDSLGMRSMPPLALYYLSTILKNNGFNVRVIDPHCLKEKGFFLNTDKALQIVKEFISEGYDAVTISSNSGNWSIAKNIIDLFKKVDNEIPIIVGGLHATYFDEYILNTTGTDFIIRGEGEKTLVQLLRILNDFDALSKLGGISYKNKNGVIMKNSENKLIESSQLSSYPSPDYSTLPKGIYTHIPLETSRGCKYSCIFCSVTNRKIWRSFEREVVLEKINSIKEFVYDKTVNGNNVYFVDDCFSADQERAIDILHKIDASNLNLKFGIECRVTDLLKPGFIEQIPKHLISFIQIGVEAGYNEGLKHVKKGITVEQVEECAKLISKYGFSDISSFSFIIGFPWEDIHQINKTIHFLGHLGDMYGIRSSISWLWLCPSDLWNNRKKYDIIVTEEIFDNPLWVISKDIFLHTHLNVDMNIYEKCEKLIGVYQSTGLSISHTSTLI